MAPTACGSRSKKNSVFINGSPERSTQADTANPPGKPRHIYRTAPEMPQGGCEQEVEVHGLKSTRRERTACSGTRKRIPEHTVAPRYFRDGQLRGERCCVRRKRRKKGLPRAVVKCNLCRVTSRCLGREASTNESHPGCYVLCLWRGKV